MPSVYASPASTPELAGPSQAGLLPRAVDLQAFEPGQAVESAAARPGALAAAGAGRWPPLRTEPRYPAG